MRLVAKLLLDSLELMDREASAPCKGFPTGLNWYGGYAKPNQSKPQTEPCWSQRLAQLLTTGGVPTKAEVPFPKAPRKKCDLVAALGANQFAWLEVKGAWREYWRKQNKLHTFRSHLLHPLVPGLDATKSHTAATDLTEKLLMLKPNDAAFIGFLLIGFDSTQAGMDKDVEELIRLVPLGQDRWSSAYRQWPDVYRPDERVRCWFWYRAVA